MTGSGTSSDAVERSRRELLEALRKRGADDETLRLAEAALSSPTPNVTLPPQAPTLPATNATMRAAIAHTFTIAEASRTAGAQRSDEIVPIDADERQSLLANSQIVTIGGRNRLQLTDEARGDLLNRVGASMEFAQLLSKAVDADGDSFEQITNDPIALPAAWLRCFIKGNHGDLRSAPPSELRAAVEALERLQYVELKTIQLPSLAEARRLLEWSELLEPLRVLIGSTGGWDGTPHSDRFTGREEQLRQLRSFVDELSSEGAMELLGRFATRNIKAVSRALGERNESVCFLVARGGLGKSALMAKFVLDHALNQDRPFPFVYLDFDRPVLHPREPRQLLLEVARQVSLQFPRVEPELRALRERISSALTQRLSDSVTDDPFTAFRRIIQTNITRESRAFLVVLDTMEVVQYDPASLKGVVAFVQRLDGSSHGDVFPELRVVAAGRADIPELRTGEDARDESHRITLQPFNVREAAHMANNLGHALLGPEWRDEWGVRIAGKSNDPPERREPLSLRVCVELVRSANPSERQSILNEIATHGEAAQEQAFVAKLYLVRVLRHVRNEYARNLAWPGLVVRHVTLEIVTEELAKLCGLDAEQAKNGFEALGNEVWMVQRVGNELWHRQDLRARTLPLMKRHDPKRFKEVNEAAKRYYGARRSDGRAHAEWLYYRLLNDEDPEQVDLDWRDDVATRLAGAAEDLEPNSPQHAYLVSRTATKLLPSAQIRRIPPRLALDHIARTGEQLGTFNDTKVEPVIADVSVRVAKDGVRSSRPHPIREVLLIKTGHWHIDASSDDASGPWAEHAEFAQRFKRAHTVSDTGDVYAGMSLGWADEYSLVRTQVQDLAYARLRRLPMAAGIDERLATLLHRRPPIDGHADLAALRLAAVFSRESFESAARAWLKCAGSVKWTVSPPTISLAELRALFQGGKRIRSILKSELVNVLANAGLRWKDLLKLARDSLAQPIVLTDPAIERMLSNCIDELADEKGSAVEQSLRYFFAARDDDWVVPMGYAAARTRPSKECMREIKYRFESHSATRGFFARRSRAGFPDDPVKLLRNADDAADLLGVAHIFEEMGGARADDLRTLLRHHASWRERIQQMLEAGEAWTEAAALPAPPRPGPVLHKDDCQKDRWGGSEMREGRRLEAVLGDVEQDDFDFNVTVRSTDGSTLEGPVVFHLHDTYPRQKIWIRKIRDGTRATFEEVNAYGVYTIGAQVKTRTGLWTSLELDLATLPELPKRFLDR